jgi:hypothetical protein
MEPAPIHTSHLSDPSTMTSFRQIEANRRNALKSTGPKTLNGKRIQGEILRDRRNDFAPLGHPPGDQLGIGREEEDQAAAQDGRCEDFDDRRAAMPPRALTYCFRRLGNLDNGAFERLGRYHAALWKQTAQTLFLLQGRRSCAARPR